MNTDQKKPVSLEDVQNQANKMIGRGENPTVNSVIDVIGGRRENVGKYLKAFWDKRDEEAAKIADEIGSSEIGRLLAVEMHNIVTRKTESMRSIINRQKDQLDEWQQLTEAHEAECQERIELAQIEADKQIRLSDEAAQKAIVRADKADTARELSEKETLANQNAAEKEIAMEKQKATTLVEAAKAEANALVSAAMVRLDKSETQCQTLREQVNALNVDEARRQIEHQQYEKALEKLDKLQSDLAEYKTAGVKLTAEAESYKRDITRLTTDLTEAKVRLEKSADAQSLLIEAKNQISQLQHDLTQSEREKQSLSQALAASSGKK
jgi:chromosome segregation ATPase